MPAKPVRFAPSPAASTPARGTCPALHARPRRCARALCRRHRVCPNAPPNVDVLSGPGPWPREQRDQAFAAWVLKVQGYDDLEHLRETLVARGLKQEHRRRKAARRAERAGLAETPSGQANGANGHDETGTRPLIRRL